MTRFFLLLICCGGYWVAMGQSVKVAGKILDGELGSEVFGATAALYEETNLVTGVTSDLDGVYELEVDPGSYQLIISYLGYESDTTQLTLAAGDAHYEETLLYTESTLMEEVTVVDQAIQSSEIAIYKKKQNGLNSIDGITLDLIKRTGDNNLAKALTRVVGVSIEDGKYVSVRGLGDRYSKTILNGGEMPALDPERNTAQLDIFPSNLIDNITVYKSFTPDLPGSFTGGLVDIQTKSHPEKMLLNFSASFGFNPVANFRDDFLSYESSSTDVFGFDDGLRDIPAIVREVEAGYQLDNGDPNETETINTIPVVGISTRDSARAFLADEVSRSFPAFYTIREKQSGLNQNYQLSLGNKFNLLGKPLGFVVGLSYRLGYQYYEDYQVGRYTLQDSSRVRIDQEVTGQYAKENALWGAVAGISYKPTTSSKISFTYMRNQSGGNETRRQQGFYDEGAPDELVNETMSFQQRSLDVFQLKGSHKLGKIDFNWIATQTNARDEQPDFRIFSYFRGTRDFPKVDENGVVIIGDDGLPIFEETQVADFRKSVNVNPFRFYRFMEELNRDAKLYFSWPFQLNDRDASLKFGAAYTTKDRDFQEKQYQISLTSGEFRRNFIPTHGGDPAAYFNPSRFGIAETINPLSGRPRYEFDFPYEEGTDPRNTYSAQQNIYAGFLMGEIPLSTRIKFVGGARFETTDISLSTAELANGTAITSSIEEADLLPAATMIYKLTKKMNLRASYTRTLARPSFRELAPYTTFAFIGGLRFTGDTTLQRTLIDNFDVRWELFPGGTEIVSVSGFYKNLQNPIERLFTRSGQNNQRNTSITNVPEARVYGVELELRKNLGFLSPLLRPLQVGGNFTYIHSEVDLDSITLATAKIVNPNSPATRPLYGQPDYTLNFEVAWIDNLNTGLQVSLSYSIFGERLVLAGARGFNVYEQPRGLLNLSVRKTFGDHFAVRLRANNLLDPDYSQVYRFFDGAPESFPFENYRLGRSYSLGLSYSF